MADELPDAFFPIRDKQGNVTGILDQMTADYLTSKAPDPTQASIDALLRAVTRIRVVPHSNFFQGAEPRTLLDTSDPVSLESFRGCFAIVEDPATFGHCMCCGDPHIELYSKDRLIATLGYHHGFAVRWDVWKHDACLMEPDRLLDWLSARGVDGPRREVEESKRQAEESREAVERWLAATPECFRPFWEKADFGGRDPELHRLMLDALRATLPEPQAQALALFGWFGSGEGPWSGYPAYESVPEQLLLYYPTQLLVDALTATTPNEAQWLGAARYFAGWDFSRAKKRERKYLPDSLKRRLFEVAQKSELADNVERAARAYGGNP